MKVDADKKTAEIDLSKNATYIVKDGKIEMVDPLPHGFGEQVITWQDGRPVYMKISYTEKV